jgi:hypothetical protein
LLRSTAQWRPASPADEEPADDQQYGVDEEASNVPSPANKSAPQDLKLGDSRLDHLLADLIKDSHEPPLRTESHLAPAESAPRSPAVEFEPSQTSDFYAELDDDDDDDADAGEALPQRREEVQVPTFGADAPSSEIPADLRTAPRPKRKPKVVRMLVGVVVGGVVGIGLGAYGLLWLKGSQADVLGMAQWLPPAMLPTSVKQIAGDDAAANDTGDEAREERKSALAAIAPPKPRFDPAVEPASVEEPVTAPSTEPSAGDRLTFIPETTAPTPALPAAEQPATESASSMVAHLRGVQLYTIGDLEASLEPAQAALRSFLAGDLAQQQSWSTMGPAYITLAELAERFTLIDPAEQGAEPTAGHNSAQEIFRNLIADPARRVDLATVAARWLQHDRRQNQGVIVVGTVNSVASPGAWTELNVGVPLGDDVVTSRVLTTESHFHRGDNIAVVGAILQQPREQLPGYEGDPSSVVLASWAFTPTAAVAPESDPSERAP